MQNNLTRSDRTLKELTAKTRCFAAILLVLNIGLILSQLPVAKRAFSRLKGISV